MNLSKAELAKLIDHTNLRPDAVRADIVRLCAEAREFGFGAVCVASCYTPTAVSQLYGTGIKVCTVIGFPHGTASLAAKVAEARQAALDGTDEIDVVLNVGAIKEGDTAYAMSEADKVIEGARDIRKDIHVKLILETGYLTDQEKLVGCWVATGAGADAVKTSTGYGPKGATAEDVRFLRRAVGSALGVKAAGGIRNLAFALAMLEAGADRLGTSSGVAIMQEWPGMWGC
ncbi:deoxyribose-phosphate aldolase [Desulforudis sp. 1088]|uniref:deoxyribose-phosphate aldolase n=1 Tax=unclassified Candidatus Desulforudis TaxID=2635950 RepID=UPI003CE44BBE